MNRDASVLSRKVVVAAFALVLAFCGAAWAQRRDCLDCHKDFKDVLKKSHVHAPAKESCEKCHQRHGFTQKLVLVKAPPELCTDCHEGVKNEIAAGRVHGALSKGGCTVCHDPHASDGKTLLRTTYKESSVCLPCHQDLRAAIESEDTHAPFRDGQCSTCHAPHSSDKPHLLVAAEKDLCETCHRGSRERHQMAGVEDFSCSSCHDPHAATKKSPLAASAHDPFASGDCEACHTLAGGAVTIGDDFPRDDLCADCHDDITTLLGGPQSHFGASELKSRGTAACLECHDPHGSGRAAMLASTENGLCRKCHESLPQVGKHKGTLHRPFIDGRCTTCHDPHGGSAPHKLVKAGGELCATCHEDITKPPQAGKTVHAAMEVSECTDCHSGHASDGIGLLSKSMGEICGTCHEKEKHRLLHPPYLTSSCEACHRNHSHEKGLMAGPARETCGACHSQELRALGADTKHPPAQEDDCLACHKPHGSEEQGLLAESQGDLCASCHDVGELVAGSAVSPAGKSGKNETAPALHQPVAEGKCAGCHNPHGSPLPALLNREGDGLCYGCHAQERATFAAGNVHPPVGEGKCSTCHTPHGSSFGGLAPKKQPDLCAQCHDLSGAPLKEAHKGFDVSEATCTACHAPHSSPKPGLLNAVVHEPFADGDCGTCHDVSNTAEGAAKLGAVSPGVCVDCHDDKQAGKGHQHVEGVACNTCHEPHSSPHEHLIDNPTQLCRGCHEDVLRADLSAGGALQVHKPIEDNGCRACHRLHDSPGAPFLADAQQDLCAGCHESVRARKADLTQHDPFRKGQCSRCHETHVASERHLLKVEERRLCKSCHGLTTETMTKAHKGVPLTGEACAGCHDPHSTKTAGSALVYPKKHPPYADNDCSACHDAQGKATTAASTCVGCHEGQNGYAAVHNGGRGGDQAGVVAACLDCHSPHAGYDGLLVRGSEKETCLQCHDRKEFSRQFAHAALEDGCATCHNVHDNNIAELRGVKVNDLCAGCHEEAKMHVHPIGTDHHDPRTDSAMTCVSCHEVHSADHEYLLTFDRKRDLCVQCHASDTMKTR